MKKLLSMIAAMCCLVATTALATPYYSPSQAELLSYDLLATDVYGARVDTPYDDGVGGAGFYAKFSSIAPAHNAFAFFGKNYGSGIDLSSYDSFKVRIRNGNENPWKFKISLINGIEVNSAEVIIPNKKSATVSLDLASLGADFLDDVKTIGVTVYEYVPIVDEYGVRDYVAEFGVAPVPEPGTMVLLGVGFLGLAIYGKRRRNS